MNSTMVNFNIALYETVGEPRMISLFFKQFNLLLDDCIERYGTFKQIESYNLIEA